MGTPKLALLLALAVASSAAAEEVVVEIKDFRFIPETLTVSPGDTVRWVNREKRQYHSVWFEQLGEPEPPYLFPEEETSRLFEQAGEFPYRCGPHPEMTGVVRVEE